MFRLLNLSKDFALRRTAFGQLLSENPLHMQTLARLEVNYCYCVAIGDVVIFLESTDA